MSYAPLPGRTEDTSAIYEQHLTCLLHLLGMEPPGPADDSRSAHRDWQNRVRRAIGQAVSARQASEDWFEPLVRAAVYEPNPSANRQLVEPAVIAFGRRRFKVKLIEYLRHGTNAERAGAARAWYWTIVPLRFVGGSPSPTPESMAERDAVADLHREWQETALQVFTANEDLDVRRCILPGLVLRADFYPEHLRAAVREAIRIARTHPDEYLRHRVEIQVRSRLATTSLPPPIR
jgi:hypothetical protein